MFDKHSISILSPKFRHFSSRAFWLRLWLIALIIFPLIASAQSNEADESTEAPRDIGDGPTWILLGGGKIPPAISSALADIKSDSEILLIANQNQNDILKLPQSRDRKFKSVNPADPLAIAAMSASASARIIDVSALPSESRFVAPFIIDSDFADAAIPAPLLQTLTQNPGTIGLALKPGQAALIRGRKISLIGDSELTLILPASVSQPDARPIKKITLKGKSRQDLTALSRAAIARLGPEFPPKSVGKPEVPHGTLLPCGGGDLPDSVWNRFITLAGGPNAPIVFLTAGQPNPDTPTPRGLDRLKALGCTQITVLPQHTKEAVRSDAFVTAVKKASGVWLAGGKQWRYIDAFEDTPAESLFRDVLKRGGVIGGSSAGAALQSDYMVRGDPQTNKTIIGEGYERGLNFLPGTAIDVHVSERNRLDSMHKLIRQYPQLLGIAIDEKTGAEISGHTLTTWGDGAVHIAISDGSAPLKLTASDKFDLQTRIKRP